MAASKPFKFFKSWLFKKAKASSAVIKSFILIFLFFIRALFKNNLISVHEPKMRGRVTTVARPVAYRRRRLAI